MDQPLWLEHAWRELGQTERAGGADNPRVLALYRDAGHGEVAHDEVAWCAALVGAALERARVRSTRSLLARSYLTWGEPLGDGRLGAVAVLERGSDPAAGHVGFLIGEAGDTILLLGGNQSDSVAVAAFARSRLLGLRWPAAAAVTAPRPEEAPGDGFARALAHVLEMEGGYGEDPYDPGGPTNFGITLAEFASWRGVRLDAGGLADLKGELKRIAPETVREIYLRRYWVPAGCAELAAPLALMHFDAAVNQGVGTAIRFLQEAVGTVADGEIGPLTRAALARTPVDKALALYAELRRRRYRALPHFWRFGRGWLKRVDRTLARAHAILGQTTSASIPENEGDHTMTNEPAQVPPAKWWGQSMTIWGAFVTGLATVLPAFGPLIGIDITGDLVQDAGDQIVTAIQAVAALAGTIMTVYGRVRATQPLERRAVSLRI
jgi:uncharacterized protein (TIGR02594 family)